MQQDEATHRGRHRDRALLRTFTASAGLQIATVAGAVVSLPFVTRSLSTPEYGVLATLTGFVALLGFADLGIGAALTNRLAEAMGRDDQDAPKKLVSTAMVGAGIAAVLVFAAGALCTITLPWQALLGAHSIPESTLRACVLCLVICTSVAIVGSLGQRILYGLQRGSAANHWLVGATCASAGTSILVSATGAPLWVYVLATVGAPALVSLICTWRVVVVGTGNLDLRPRRQSVARAGLLDLAGTSGWFFAIAVATAMGYQTDSLVVAAILGASSAGVYSVALRLFGLLSQSVHPVLLQLWPAFGEALARGDTAWIRTRFRWSMILASVVSGLIGTVLVILGPSLVALWLTAALTPSRSLLIAMAVWTAYSLGTIPMFFLLYAAGKVRISALMAVAVAIANVPLSILFTHTVGITGPVLGSLVATILFSGVPGSLAVHRLLRDAPEFAKPDDGDPRTAHGAT
jgi:O-antigen/teichoic acid export membrane protein